MSTSAVPLQPRTDDNRQHVVVVAASAGGIQALRTILPQLPEKFSAPVVVVLHRTAGRPGVLAQVLGRGSGLLVKDAEDGERLVPGRVYVAPADRHTHLTPGGHVSFRDNAKVNFLRSSADPLFRSAAAVYGPGAIAVVLSGGGRNGAAGAKAVKDAGGVVIAQDRETSQHFAMPRAAIEAGAVTDVLPLQDIAARLASLTNGRSPAAR